MKKLLTIICLVLASAISMAQCPDSGATRNHKIAQLNVLKNRNVVTDSRRAKAITLDSVLAPGKDENRFSNTDFVVMDGWVTKFKDGGPESCNCKSRYVSDWDIHIVVGKTPDSPEDSCMVVEVTAKSKIKMGITDARKFGRTILHHEIRIYGYMMWDFEHSKNSVNTAKPGTRDIFRKTAWEIHPVTEIDMIR